MPLGQGRWQDDLAKILLIPLDVLANGLIQALHMPGIDDDARCENSLISLGGLSLWISHQEVDDELFLAVGNQREVCVVAATCIVICCDLHLSFGQVEPPPSSNHGTRHLSWKKGGLRFERYRATTANGVRGWVGNRQRQRFAHAFLGDSHGQGSVLHYD